MRIAILTLALFCALISGWTAALAQVQGLGATGHIRNSAVHHAAPAGHVCKAAAPCAPQPKMVHPMSCAACFAVVLAAYGINRIERPAGTVLPALQKPMLATVLKPHFPPPKPFLPLS